MMKKAFSGQLWNAADGADRRFHNSVLAWGKARMPQNGGRTPSSARVPLDPLFGPEHQCLAASNTLTDGGQGDVSRDLQP
jgi:hypothetical protein